MNIYLLLKSLNIPHCFNLRGRAYIAKPPLRFLIPYGAKSFIFTTF